MELPWAVLSAAGQRLAIVAFLVLFMWRAPPWLVVFLCAVAAAAAAGVR
jgi:hypothetical protein